MESQEGGIEIKVSDDEEYMRRYSVVGELYYAKRKLIRKLQKEENGESSEKIGELNSKIKTAEDAFLKDVIELISDGRKFSFEVMAEEFGLKLYEKRVLLFFCFIHFFCKSASNLCPDAELSEIFDLEDSLFARMRDFKYLIRSAPLLKNDLLGKKSEYRDLEQHTRSLGLSGKVLAIFSRNLLKELPSEDEKLKTEGKDGECECCETPEEKEKSVKDVGFFLEPRYRFEDVVLPDVLRDKVMFFLQTFADPGLDQFGAGDILKKGKGLVFLFYGPPGTGKSMLAEGIASYLGKKMLMAEMPKLTRKWYGETDKAIADLFRLAKEQNLVLCMNEADSFLYDRTFGVQEHDIRFVNVMLQEIERFEGVAVFTTNMDALLDPALERRVSLRIPFALPDEKIRAQIWRKHIPQSLRLAEDVNFDQLAHTFDFSGGYIKNAVMNAARRIVLDKRDVMTKEDLLFGAQMEKDGLYNKELKKGPVGFAF